MASGYSLDYGGRQPGEKLTSFIDNNVNPDTPYLADCGQHINDIVSFMHTVVPYNVASTTIV